MEDTPPPPPSIRIVYLPLQLLPELEEPWVHTLEGDLHLVNPNLGLDPRLAPAIKVLMVLILAVAGAQRKERRMLEGWLLVISLMRVIKPVDLLERRSLIPSPTKFPIMAQVVLLVPPHHHIQALAQYPQEKRNQNLVNRQPLVQA